MSARRFRGALIGCGFFSPNHLNAWLAIPEVQIVALCDTDLVRAQSLGRQFSIDTHYSDAAAMLEREALDFVDIVTTPPSHRALVTLAAPYVHLIICQKPFAESLQDADAMVEACEKVGATLVIHENFRWQHPFRRLADLLTRGLIGRPTSLKLLFHHHYDIYERQPYLAVVERLALMDVGLHLFDLARFLLGEVTSLHCRTSRLNPRVKGEDSFIATVRFETGAIGLIDCSFFSQRTPDLFPQTLALIEGTEGALELKADYRLTVYRAGSTEEADVEPPLLPWAEKPWHVIQDSVLQFQRHVVEVLGGRSQPQPSGSHNRDTLALALIAYRSAKEDRVISIDPSKRLTP
jgi:predicted dehydrogenase